MIDEKPDYCCNGIGWYKRNIMITHFLQLDMVKKQVYKGINFYRVRKLNATMNLIPVPGKTLTGP